VSGLAVLKPSVAGPYRYLDYFHEEDHLSFAGREEDIAEVAARASADEPFVLYGRSGLGKTSLLLAGVFPVLRDRNLHTISTS
jgi:chromosomal replication initiation ATPase DnaA